MNHIGSRQEAEAAVADLRFRLWDTACALLAAEMFSSEGHDDKDAKAYAKLAVQCIEMERVLAFNIGREK